MNGEQHAAAAYGLWTLVLVNSARTGGTPLEQGGRA
jgi:hypothetical protein